MLVSDCGPMIPYLRLLITEGAAGSMARGAAGERRAAD